ncbi:hypothetical protein DIT71_04935 [Marinobacter vulgaris]|uniref:Uncharacterized protein n=1 Tax=Marinobacter vulgaris TaxID=1928331 RepID=A0A2V3ZN57_9GAMM|nr:hypothetical protein [Marinobacter vulgaris]PXX92539.1 hypothetical protein DIT71_04935 [Marinobacter vulgaris]TSJ71516.1 hypothetical protein FPC41_04535 [Marinobacter vulgaris]
MDIGGLGVVFYFLGKKNSLRSDTFFLAEIKHHPQTAVEPLQFVGLKTKSFPIGCFQRKVGDGMATLMTEAVVAGVQKMWSARDGATKPPMDGFTGVFLNPRHH